VLAVAGGTGQAPARIELPGGVWRKKSRAPLRQVALRPVGPEDEMFLLDTAGDELLSRRGSELLARCIVEPTSADEVSAELTVGDREALLLHLRRLTLGETVECVVRCPADACDEVMELELHVEDLLVPPYGDVRAEYELGVDDPDGRYEIAFRLPKARDLDRAAALAGRPEEAVAALLQSCVSDVTRDGAKATVADLPERARDAVAEAMADRDPQAELQLDLSCPACEASFSVVFDAASFFLQELDGKIAQLLADVHALARHYHWSEREILDLPPARRARYLELIAGGAAAR
jgi:base plate protein